MLNFLKTCFSGITCWVIHQGVTWTDPCLLGDKGLWKIELQF